MIEIDIAKFVQEHWSSYKKSVTELSKSNHTTLVENSMELYCFDDICDNLYSKEKKPTSADAFLIDGQSVELVEFKSGFKNKITKKNFDVEQARCRDADKICTDYWRLFSEKRKKEINELVQNIRIKAIESYITLEKFIFPCCQSSEAKFQLKFLVVIDADSIDGMEETLAELAGISSSQDNPYTSIKKSLRRLVNCVDINENPYFYDDINVLSVMDFQNYLNLLNQ